MRAMVRRRPPFALSRLFAVSIVASAAPTIAAAQPVLTLPPPPVTLPFLPSPSGLWTVTVGIGGELKPDFEGAKRYMLSPVPIISIERAGSSARFQSPRDNPGIALIEAGGFRAGPVGKYTSARTAASDPELTGLGDVKAAIELGVFAEYYPVDWFRARAEIRRGFGGHDGIVADLTADVILPLSDRLTWSGGPRLSFADTRATAPYFGITAAQALTSGLPAFDAKGGAHSAGAGTQLKYQLTPQWETHGYVEYDRLLGDAAASPLVTQRGSPNQVKAGVGVSYSFDVKVR
jgi:MipA family protein